MNSQTITDKAEMMKIIDSCEVCYIGMSDNNVPYVLPFNFAREGESLYLHSAPEGKKISILERNNQLCISFSTDHKMYFQHEKVACSWGMLFNSVIAWGSVEYLEDLKDKEHCLNLFMKKYSGKEGFTYSLPALKNVKVLKIDLTKMTGKKRGM